MTKLDYKHWMSKPAAAAAIGCSPKTIEALSKAGQLHQAYWKRPETGATIVVYHPSDVERIRKERNPAGAEAFPVPDQAPAASTALVAPPTSPEQFIRALVALAGGSENSAKHSQKHSDVRLAERLFLTISEAAEFSGLPKVHLRRLLAAGTLQALKTGRGWRVRRHNLEDI